MSLFDEISISSRSFVHKKFLKAAVGFIPGGSTALSVFNVARSLTGGGGGPLSVAPTLNCSTDAGFRQLVATKSWAEVARICGTTVAAAQARFAPFRAGGGSPASTGLVPRTSPSCATDAGFRQLVNTKSWAEVASICGTSVAAAQARFAPFREGASPSIPPPNPVREAVLSAKPLDLVAFPRRPRQRIPFVQPLPTPHPVSLTTRSAAMPFHKPLLQRFLGGGDECLPGQFKVAGVCVDPSAAFPGGDPLFSLGPEAVMGRYGSAYVGNSRLINRTTCLPGDLVGDDGLCYNRKSLTNKERMWPRGRQPLLTGGEMRAISIASRAAGKFERTQKRLQKMGMIKKPASRRGAASGRVQAGPGPHQHQISSGG